MNVYMFNFPKRPNSTKKPADYSAGTLFACTLIENTSIITPSLSLKAPANLSEENNQRNTVVRDEVEENSDAYDMVTILDNGLVSDGTAHEYVTATFDDISDYSEIYLSFTYNGVPQVMLMKIDVSTIGTGADYTILFEPADLYFRFHLTKTSIRGTQYAGSWVDITATIYTLVEHVEPTPPEPPTPPTPVNKIYLFNYCYVEDFGRWYFIRNVTYELGTWQFDLEIDVLATYKSAIGSSTQYVLRSASEFDGEIIDSAYPTKANLKVRTVTANKTIFGDTIEPYFIVGIVGGIIANTDDEISQKAFNGSVVYFALTSGQLYQLVKTFLSNVNMYNVPTIEISEALQKQLLNPIQYIHSIKCIPFEPSTAQNTVNEVMLGFNNLTIQELTPTPP
mgnify:CR=1 FL=1